MQEKLKWVSQFKPTVIDSIDLQPYDVYIDDENNEVDGHLPKKFYRCETKHFNELINDLKHNPFTRYTTYFNDVVDTLVPENISVLQKTFSYHIANPERESMVGKLLNYMGIPTTYNLLRKLDGKPVNDYDVLSVDMISQDEKFYSFADFDFKGFINLYGSIEKLKQVVDKFKFKSEYEKEINYKNILNDFLLTYMVRGWILGDSDFRDRNVGLLYNEKTCQLKLINFDYEQCFMADIVGVLENYGHLDRDIYLYMKNDYPEIYQKFISIAEEFSEKLKGVSEASLKSESKNFARDMMFLKQNCKAVLKYNSNLDKKISRYKKYEEMLLNAKESQKRDWLIMQ